MRPLHAAQAEIRGALTDYAVLMTTRERSVPQLAPSVLSLGRRFPLTALFEPGSMSALSPLCAGKRTSVSRSDHAAAARRARREFSGSGTTTLARRGLICRTADAGELWEGRQSAHRTGYRKSGDACGNDRHHAIAGQPFHEQIPQIRLHRLQRKDRSPPIVVELSPER
jgi:hypothetical protein